VDADNRFVYAADLGTDKIMSYRLESETGILYPAEQPSVAVIPGSGPRHMAFNRKGNMLYLAEELSSTVTAFRISSSDGSLTSIQTLSTLPEGFDEMNTVADIHFTPDERLLFVSNRGHNSLAIFRVLDDGTLEVTGYEPVLGNHPRNFMVDPKGKFLLVANRNTDNVNQFGIGEKADTIGFTGTTLEIPVPVCLIWHILPNNR
jgi:6-phosphogluconolactonase